MRDQRRRDGCEYYSSSCIRRDRVVCPGSLEQREADRFLIEMIFEETVFSMRFQAGHINSNFLLATFSRHP